MILFSNRDLDEIYMSDERRKIRIIFIIELSSNILTSMKNISHSDKYFQDL